MERIFRSPHCKLALIVTRGNGKHRIELIDKFEKKNKKAVSVLLHSTYKDIKKDLHKNNIRHSKVFFIDIFSNHYLDCSDSSDCRFLKNPKLNELLLVLENAVFEKGCEFILFDNFSVLLSFYPHHDLLKLTNHMTSHEAFSSKKKIMIIPQEEDYLKEDTEKLIKDMHLFADVVLNM